MNFNNNSGDSPSSYGVEEKQKPSEDQKIAKAFRSINKKPLKLNRHPAPTISLAQVTPKKQHSHKTYVTKEESDDFKQLNKNDDLTEREMLLVWAAARAAVNIGLNATWERDHQQKNQVINVTLIKMIGDAPGVPDSAVLEINSLATIKQLRDQLQSQLQELADRHNSAQSNPQYAQMVVMVKVLGIYETDDNGESQIALLDTFSKIPPDVVATIAIHFLHPLK